MYNDWLLATYLSVAEGISLSFSKRGMLLITSATFSISAATLLILRTAFTKSPRNTPVLSLHI